ncbi:MAG: monovalent cation:proton antiporter-2 (CPA2) family protein [Acidiferrobacterales bacterium]
MGLLHESAIFLGAAIVAVPLFRRLGFGSVLGYLVAGIVIGPWGLGLISNVDNILRFAELGVILLLFIIGLELQPSRLWVLRKSIFGLGAAQVIVTGALLALAAYALGLDTQAAIIAGAGLALSSTAFVLQMLAEKKQLTTSYGRSAFAVLLFQDLAVIPLLALVTLLGTVGTAQQTGDSTPLHAAQIVLVLAALVVGGRFSLRHVLRAVATSGSQEIFTATALLVVIGAALLMESVDLPMGLGAFLAGVLLADSEYRHELEANIEPFKGLLLGLFFIAVGMWANLGLVVGQPLQVLALVVALLTIKFVVLFTLARLFGHNTESARNLAFVLPQGGEFAFVLFSVAVVHGLLSKSIADLLIVVVTVTMAATPLLVVFNESVLRSRFQAGKTKPYDEMQDPEHEVIIAGFGRVGQVIGRMLRVKKIPFTALEVSSTQVDFVRRFGNKVYYGDASRLDLLRAANADKAKILVLAIDDIISSVRTAETVKRHFPNLEIYARARNRHHAHLLMDCGAKKIMRETFLSSLDIAEQVLRGLGEPDEQVKRAGMLFRQHDEETLVKQHAIHHDESKLIQTAKESAHELEEVFESDTEPASLGSGTASK